jgi:hypothetical protein
VYTTPYQWSFPLNLPPQFFGIFPAGELLDEDTTTPWADEIEQKLLLPPPIGIDQYVRFTEVAFFHKASRSLLVTDAVVYVDDKPPEVIPKKVGHLMWALCALSCVGQGLNLVGGVWPFSWGSCM